MIPIEPTCTNANDKNVCQAALLLIPTEVAPAAVTAVSRMLNTKLSVKLKNKNTSEEE